MPKKKNKIVLDERQGKFLGLYLDPKSKTFSNALQSALNAGFSQKYAENITALMPDWLGENIGKGYLIHKAESNLKDFLELTTKLPVVTMIGILKDEKGNVVKKENANLLKIKADISKFVSERLNRGKYGKEEGQTLNQINVFYIPQSLAKKYGIKATPITQSTGGDSE